MKEILRYAQNDSIILDNDKMLSAVVYGETLTNLAETISPEPVTIGYKQNFTPNEYIEYPIVATEGKMLQIGCIGVVFITISVYLYKILTIMNMKGVITIITAVAFVFQTLAMLILIKIPEFGILSLIGAETVFWLIMLCLETGLLLTILKGKKIPFVLS